MEGPKENPGVYSRAIQELFAVRDTRAKEYNYTIAVSMLEVYNEQIRDMLVESYLDNELEIKQNSTGTGTVVQGLTEVVVKSVEDVIAIIEKGQKNRAVSQTSMNERSSRSHAMLRVTVTGKNMIIPDSPTTTGKTVQ